MFDMILSNVVLDICQSAFKKIIISCEKVRLMVGQPLCDDPLWARAAYLELGHRLISHSIGLYRLTSKYLVQVILTLLSSAIEKQKFVVINKG